MNQAEIFGPFFAMIFLTIVVWAYMYSRRIPFIRSRQLTPEQLTPVEFARLQPPAVSNPSDNLKNLFELPLLFYVLSLYLFATNQVDAVYVLAAWCFVAFRCLHSAVHCTFNLIMLRFLLYLVSSLALWFIAARAAFSYLGS